MSDTTVYKDFAVECCILYLLLSSKQQRHDRWFWKHE